MAINKVILGGQVKIDLSNDTVEESKVLAGYTFHDHEGESTEGTCTFDSDTSDDTALAAEILADKTAHARGSRLVGTMPNNGSVAGTISTKTGVYTVPQGYHDGAGTVSIDSTEQAKIIDSNIKAGVTILGVVGNYSGETVTAQTKSVTPSMNAQTILPDAGYDYLAQVNVAAIPYTETPTPGGGTTLTIG